MPLLQILRPTLPILIGASIMLTLFVPLSVAALGILMRGSSFAFRKTVFVDERSFFHRYAGLTAEEAEHAARGIWASINAVNLRENILPTRERAHLIIEKGPDHSVAGIHLRKS